MQAWSSLRMSIIRSTYRRAAAAPTSMCVRSCWMRFRLGSQPRSASHCQSNESEQAYHHAPPHEQRKSVARDVAEKGLHHEPGASKRYDETHGDDRDVGEGQLTMFFVETATDPPTHGRHGEPERELRGRPAVGAQQHGGDNGCAGA